MTSMSSLTNTNNKSSTGISSGVGGLVSGMDTDSIIEKLTAMNQKKIDTQDQKLQKQQWKQGAYRTIISAMQEFQRSYLDILSSSYIGSTATFNTTKATSSSNAVSVSTTGNSYEGSFIINSINQLATAETMMSSSAVTAGMNGTVSAASIASNISSLSGKSISLTLDGTVRTITFDDSFIANVGSAGLPAALQTAVDNAFGVTSSDDRVITVGTDSSGNLSFSAPGSVLSINAVDKDTATITALGFTDNQSNKLSTSTQLNSLNLVADKGTAGTYKFTINGVKFEFSGDTSLSKMMSQINSSNAGVTISYSSITDKFTMTADKTGSGANITVADTSGTLMAALGLTSSTGTVTEGKNAILYVGGQKLIRSSNDITINGTKVTLENTSSDAITVNMKADASGLKDKITKFVDDYNTLIEAINTSITEKPNSDYPPLTDAQKADMTDDQIAKWEAKAKAGILSSDSALRSISSKLQLIMYSSAVSGGISLMDLGITSAGYDQKGKLKVNSDKLADALTSKAAQIGELFTTKDTGLGAQMVSVFHDAISTSGPKGTRGSLVEIAGVKDTTSATQNSLYDQIEDTKDKIKTMKSNLSAEQKRLWSKFSKMETALSQLNSQSSVLTSFASGS